MKKKGGDNLVAKAVPIEVPAVKKQEHIATTADQIYMKLVVGTSRAMPLEAMAFSGAATFGSIVGELLPHIKKTCGEDGQTFYDNATETIARGEKYSLKIGGKVAQMEDHLHEYAAWNAKTQQFVMVAKITEFAEDGSSIEDML